MTFEQLDGNDAVLAPLLASATDDEANRALAELLDTHVVWRVERILDRQFARSRMNPHHREDLRSDILLRLLTHLQRVRADGPRIGDFKAYVSVVAFHAFDDLLRRAYPLRAKLKNQIRYVLREDARFSTWKSDGGETLCGLREWEGRTAGAVSPGWRVSAGDVRAALVELFRLSGAPLELDDVTGLLGAALIPPQGAPPEAAEEAADERLPGDNLENEEQLRQVWTEIIALPVHQRVALILHARDSAGESVTRLLCLTGLASVRDIARTLEMEPQAFASLWQDLPLDDLRIAGILQCTRQQVINARRSARERLVRRLRAAAKGGGGFA
jgi:RNA polymerase sigma factor (sigma-70 family)